ncbi:hypothetical protein LIER_31626 [Lithospermum erythrorhizon]|uniref:UBA domain-containing protein n=1 Tax=Lithospermum erythrorhizon TaxID=34254 RepID=A0AAV3RRJ3_LITER
MEYDYRKRPVQSSSSASHHQMYGQNLYPKVGQSQPPPSSSGIGIRVAIKPEYRITPPPQMTPQMGDIPRSNFHFEFDLEKKILAEAEKETPNWSRIMGDLRFENIPSKSTESTPSFGPSPDPIVIKYLALGLSRDVVQIAVANYGDNPSKVKAFANGYNLLREMGFSSNSVVEALLMFDNDTDKALAYFLNNPS